MPVPYGLGHNKSIKSEIQEVQPTDMNAQADFWLLWHSLLKVKIENTCGLVVTVGLDQRSCTTPGPVSTGMGDPLLGSTPGAADLNSIHNQPPRSTPPGHPSVGRRNEYQPTGSDALWLRKAWFLCG